MNDLDGLVKHLEAKGPDSQGWYTACCPFHDDKHPSLRFNERGFRCMACGEKGNLGKLASKHGITQKSDKKSRPGNIVATYDYLDENGTLLFQVVRYQPKTFRQRRPDGNGGWEWNLNGIRRVLYRLPLLMIAPDDDWIFIVEGEKSVDALSQLGQTATCSPAGAGKWLEEFSSLFSGRKVVILPDNDDPGFAHGHKVAASVAPVAEELKVIHLPCLSKGQDVFDWLQAGNKIDDLLELVEAAPQRGGLDGHQILDEIFLFVRRFVVLSESQLITISLWVVHTYAFNFSDATPYINITSPEKQSGKTRLLEIFELLVAKPWFTGRVTSAVLGRKIDSECPTLLLDESDAAFKGEKEYTETLRGILNTGYRRGGKSSVCTGQGANIDYKDLSTYCPKAIAGIGKLPDTVTDRSIVIKLNRRKPSETVERFRRKKTDREAAPLRERISTWVTGLNLLDNEPYLPDQLSDRAMDCWEPLLGIAEVAGGNWPQMAREAAVVLSGMTVNEDQSLGTRLLADIKTVFDTKEADRLASADLIQALNDIEEAPWADIGRRPLVPTRLAKMLKPYGITPKTVRLHGSTAKGYERDWFADAWERYVPLYSDKMAVTPVTLATDQLQPSSRHTASGAKAGVTPALHTQPSFGVTGVTAKRLDREVDAITPDSNEEVMEWTA